MMVRLRRAWPAACARALLLLAPGEFSRILARNGGRENAFTSHDYTGYFQSVAVDRLELVMEMEADRIMFWRKPGETAQGSVVDPAREAKRIRENQALGRPITEGDTPTIERERGVRGLFN